MYAISPPLCNCDFMQSNNMQNLLLMIKLSAIFGQKLAFEEVRPLTFPQDSIDIDVANLKLKMH